ncbi:MAG TPA: hypothetical protein VNI01_07280 [Elusimicrobiota bacterium]|jgi:hypothetical protein|nr:hypothetical protein [Elusimicrobiota bacterium]
MSRSIRRGSAPGGAGAPAPGPAPAPTPALGRFCARIEHAHPFVAVLATVQLCRQAPLRLAGRCAWLARFAYVAVADECPALEFAARGWLATLEPWALAAAEQARARLATDPTAADVERDVFEASAALSALAAVLADADTSEGYRRVAEAQKTLLELNAGLRGLPAGLAGP